MFTLKRVPQQAVAATRVLFTGRATAGTTASSSTLANTRTSSHDQQQHADQHHFLGPADIQLGRPSTARTVTKEEFQSFLQLNQDFRDDLAYCLSFADDGSSDFERQHLKNNDMMMDQLRISQDQLRSAFVAATPAAATVGPEQPLPRTLKEALRPTRKSAIVITEAKAPFRIVDVNAAWENLCGYSHVEAKGKTLGSLLHGDETDVFAATSLIAQLMRGEQAGTTLTNYTRTGRRFRNRIRVGPLMSDGSTEVTHFVGILAEVHGM